MQPSPPAPEVNLLYGDRLERSTPHVYVTCSLLGINAAVYLLMVWSGVSPTSPSTTDLLRWGADFGPLTTHGEWWRMLTAAFLHIGILHLASNLYTLFMLGRFVERLFGNLGFAVLYVFSALTGSLASLKFHPMTVCAGASGAVFGVCGALIGYMLRQRHLVTRESITSLAKNIGIFLVYNMIYGFANRQVDVAAHLGGLIGGVLLGLALAQVPEEISTKRARAVSIGAAIAVLAIAPFLVVNSPATTLWYQKIHNLPAVKANDKDTLYYDTIFLKTEVAAVKNALVTSGFFASQGFEAILTRPLNSPVTLVLPLEQRLVRNPIVAARLQHLGGTVAEITGGTPVKLQLVGANYQLQQELVIPFRELTFGLRDSVRYSGAILPAQARTLGARLKELGYFEDKGSFVAVTRLANQPPVLSIPANERRWPTPFEKSLGAFALQLAPVFGSKSIIVQLVDVNQKPLLQFSVTSH